MHHNSSFYSSVDSPSIKYCWAMNRITTLQLSRAVQRCTRSMHSTGSGLTSLFNVDTELKSTTNPSQFLAHITNNWSVGDAPNGGYLMAMAISAARKVITFRDPLSVSAYYCHKALENEDVEIDVKTLNATKGSATVSISFTQLGVLRSQYIGTFGTLDKQKGLNFSNINPAPELPPPDECVDCSAILRKKFGEHLRVAERVQFRAPKNDPFVLGVLAQKEVRNRMQSPLPHNYTTYQLIDICAIPSFHFLTTR